jgi:aryl-alcohol dehydrogenase-like predicted oxidoreductase
MQQRKLSEGGPTVSAIGYGAMVLIGLYGEVDEEHGARVIRHALDRGVNLIDTARRLRPGWCERATRRPRDQGPP